MAQDPGSPVPTGVPTQYVLDRILLAEDPIVSDPPLQQVARICDCRIHGGSLRIILKSTVNQKRCPKKCIMYPDPIHQDYYTGMHQRAI